MRTGHFRCWWCMLPLALVAMGISGSRASAQPKPSLALDRSFPEAFGKIGPLRELSDGRVLVADPLGKVLALLDFESGTADTLGRIGGGPQEYEQPDAVFPLVGDSSLLVDLGNARLTVVSPEGEFLETLPMAQQTLSGSLVVALPQAVDRFGRLYFRSELQPMGSYPDSTALLRLDPGTGVLDTLALLKVPELPPPPLPGGGGSRGKAAEAQDDWSVAADGRVVIVRAGDYSVSWISPDGTVQKGSSNIFSAVRIGPKEKEEWMEESLGAQVSMRSDESGTISVFRSDAEGVRSAMDRYDWPSALPPLKAGRTQLSPDGNAWVEKYVSAGEDPIVDVFHQTRGKTESFVLPSGRRLGGFGKDRVYLIFTDKFGLQWIERYRIEGP